MTGLFLALLLLLVGYLIVGVIVISTAALLDPRDPRVMDMDSFGNFFGMILGWPIVVIVGLIIGIRWLIETPIKAANRKGYERKFGSKS